VVDFRSLSNRRGFYLPGVIDGVVNPDQPGEVPLFLNNITCTASGGGEATPFYLVYPNLYVMDDNESVLITHGHYFEASIGKKLSEPESVI